MKRRVLGLTCAVVALAIPSPAGAATELGQLPAAGDPDVTCPNGTNLAQPTAGGNSYVVPAAGGVLTSWRHKGHSTAPGTGRFQVWRPNGGGFTLVGRSEIMLLTAGVVNEYAIRIPVSGGDLLGLRIATMSQGCAFGAAGTNVVRFETGAPDPGIGDSRPLPTSNIHRTNVAATLEPDCDGDGFGDETQDPELPATQACDPNAPDTTITKGPKAKTKKKSATFEFSGSDAARAVAGFECSLDGGAFAACTSPYTVKVKKGKHTLSVRATDQAGNADASPATYPWKVKKKRKR